MTVKDIMQIKPGQLRKMDRSELARTVSSLASAANKRLKNFERNEIQTPATKAVARSGGKFSVKDKDVTQLVKEFDRAKKFLQSGSGNLRENQNLRRQVETKTRTEKAKALTVPELKKATERDVNKLTDEELRETLKRISATANRRIDKLLDAGIKSKALTNVLENEGLFLNGELTNRVDIINELKRARQFLKAKGSTVSGAQRIHANLEKRLGLSIDTWQTDRLWDAYNIVNQKWPALVKNYDSEKTQIFIAKMIKERRGRRPTTEAGQERMVDELVKAAERELRIAYEQREEAKADIARGNESFRDVTGAEQERNNLSSRRNF